MDTNSLAYTQTHRLQPCKHFKENVLLQAKVFTDN